MLSSPEVPRGAFAVISAASSPVRLQADGTLPTHKIVNQQRTDMINFQTVLINTLTAHGIDVPEDQSRVQPK